MSEGETQAVFTFFQQMMNPAATTFNTLFVGMTDPKEVEKKIADLQAVKLWLTASVTTVELSIQALEFQRSLMGAGGPGAAQVQNPAEWAMTLMQRAAASGIKATEEAIQAAATAAMPKSEPKRASRKKRSVPAKG